MFFYILYRLGHFLACILPIQVSYRIADLLSFLQYLIIRRDRHAVIENLKIIHSGDTQRAKRNAYEVFRNFGLYLVDFFRFSKLDRDFIKRCVQIKGIGYLDAAIKEKKGVIVLTAHIGNWEMGGVVLGMLGYKISAAALVHSYKKINDFFVRQREAKGLMVIPVGFSSKAIVSSLKQNSILALLADRDFSDTGMSMIFLGKETSIPKGPALFSLKFGTPIIPGFFVRKDRYKYEFIFEKPIQFATEAQEDFQTSLKDLTEKNVKILEKYIRLYPTQWLIFRPFWETPSDVFIL